MSHKVIIVDLYIRHQARIFIYRNILILVVQNIQKMLYFIKLFKDYAIETNV